MERNALSQAKNIKFVPPDLDDTSVLRSGILAALSSNPRLKLVVFQAPAGFGKTTCMLQYFYSLMDAGLHPQWVTLDRYDNDIVSFIDLIRSANAQYESAIATRSESSLVRNENPLMLSTQNNGERQILFLDDFEELHDPAILELVSEGLRNLPLGRQIVIAARGVPGVAVSRLVLSGEAIIFTADDLRFSQEESEVFLPPGEFDKIKPDAQEDLLRQAEGWPAALRLYKIMLPQMDRASGPLEQITFSNNLFNDYVAENILSIVPDHLRRFLLNTCILKRLEEDLCNRITGKDDAAEILAELEQQALFISRGLNDTRYRYHNLFARIIEDFARREDAAGLAARHLEAADWYEEHDRIHDAIHHALLAEDETRLMGLLEEHALPELYRSHMGIIHEWALLIPDEAIARLPNMQLALIWAHTFCRNHTSANYHAEKLQALCASDPKVAETMLPRLAAIRSISAIFQDEFEGIDKDVERTLQGLSDSMEFERPALCNVLTYSMIIQSNFERARQVNTEALSVPTDINTSFSKTYSYALHALAQIVQGELSGALSTLAVAEEALSEYSDLDAINQASISVIKSAVLYELNRCEEARAHLEGIWPIIKAYALGDWMMAMCQTLCRIDLIEDQKQDAIERLEDLERLAYGDDLPRLASCARLELVRLFQLGGDLPRAEEIFEGHEAEGLTPKAPGFCFFPNDTEAEDITQLRLMIGLNQTAKAQTVLKVAFNTTHQRRKCRLLKLRLMAALLNRAMFETHQAQVELGKALALAEEIGAVRSIIDEGRPMLELLNAAHFEARQRSSSAMTAKRIQTIEMLLDAAGHPVSEGQRHPLLEPLTARENELLQLVADGHSNRSISEISDLTESTVKWHLGNVYSKLGVKKRTQAVANGRQLGLIT